MISASLVKELREKTGAGMLDCKKALEANDGNIDASIDWLREKGISKAAKKADRIAAEGIAAIKIEGNVAAIVEVNSETDFVAKNEEFTSMVEEILSAIVKNDVKTNEEVLALSASEGTINDLIINKTAKIFRCSKFVVARKAFDYGKISKVVYEQIIRELTLKYKAWQESQKENKNSGGDYYRTQASKMDRNFVTALARNTCEGKTQYTEAYRLTNTNRKTFGRLLEEIGGVS